MKLSTPFLEAKMRLTPKQIKKFRARKRRIREPVLVQGVSEEYLETIQRRQTVIDSWPKDIVELVHEYGFERTMRGLQSTQTVSEAREYLAQERRRNEEFRWHNNGILPPGL